MLPFGFWFILWNFNIYNQNVTMAITDVDVSDIAGYISKGTLSNSNASLAVLAQLEGNGSLTNFYTDFNQNSIGYKLSVARSSNLDSNIFASFKFDPYYIDSEQRPIDLYDSTSNSDCAIIANNDGSDTTSGTPGTLSGDLTFTRTTGTGDGGYIAPGSDNTSNNVAWPKATKSGTDYETINGSTGKTFCFWYKPRTEQPSAFAYMIADNQLTTGRYSGVIIQRPSNRNLAFTILVGTNGGGTSSSNRRSHLGVNDSLAAEEWQFIVVRAKPGSAQGTSNTYVSITTAGAGSISTSNDGISGTSGSGTTIGYNTSTSATMRWFDSGNGSGATEDQIGMMWVLPFGLDAGSSYLSDIYDATKQFYGG
tara:strand:+ start:154 stop:1251 length:1098 start_codon:yes stop_codon:yes gene_type:complete